MKRTVDRLDLKRGDVVQLWDGPWGTARVILTSFDNRERGYPVVVRPFAYRDGTVSSERFELCGAERNVTKVED